MQKSDNRDGRLAGAVDADVARHVGQRLGNPDNVRRLRALPQFSVEPDLPDQFKNLLGALDRAEKRAE
ncbi:hypothetical protein [Nitratireductor pacificus]|uniref:Anti-sigma factor NepR domain-containing protein n=1 Tax=Nitratireductor pacificus pht-3B TaxID=391937 RepID=K2LP24_9HYPH|nr:hypothetical protein [Nitratireductor pacificus]EKF19504.1 hypothetical protein NA2_08429 [Nitratireductor pacificus pht-3B]